MNLINVRFGFATNSSSTHSVVVLPEGTPMPATDEWKDFGWEYFTAADEKSKQKYALLTIRSAISNSLRSAGLLSWGDKGDLTGYLMNQWFDAGIDTSLDYRAYGDGGIDHQSVIGLPMRWDGKNIDIQFAQAFMDSMMESNVLILGGNDNDERSHHLSSLGEEWPLIAKAMLPLEGVCPSVVRYDAAYDYWTAFNRYNGTKIRFRMKSDEPIEKASYPELVDIKITDMCPFACAFCYMGSTNSGLHGQTAIIHSLIAELASKQVFEIAIGGGEPTMHPDFIDILKSARDRHVVPNFTTKNLGWLRDPKQWPKIIEYCGAFAFSADTKSQVRDLVALLDVNGISRGKATIQIIPEVMTSWTLQSVLQEAASYGLTVTLLGYKTTGRGQEYSPFKEETDWLKVVTKMKKEGLSLPRIGIDTILAANTDLSDFDDKLFTLYEGKFSMYIDAVAVKVGRSSFAEEDTFTSFGEKPSREWPKPGFATGVRLGYNNWSDALWAAFQSY